MLSKMKMIYYKVLWTENGFENDLFWYQCLPNFPFQMIGVSLPIDTILKKIYIGDRKECHSVWGRRDWN